MGCLECGTHLLQGPESTYVINLVLVVDQFLDLWNSQELPVEVEFQFKRSGEKENINNIPQS